MKHQYALVNKHLFRLILFVCVPMLVTIAISGSLHDMQFESSGVHAVIEVAGSLIAGFILSIFLMHRSLLPLHAFEAQIVMTALAAIAIFDFFHGMTSPGNNFVWFHSLATLVGGITFGFIILPSSTRILIPQMPLGMIFISLALILWSVMFEQQVPSMINNQAFSLLARLMNVLGGIGYIIASLYFVNRYSQTHSSDYFLLASHTLLFGLSGILFEFSNLWDATWWLWHALRFCAYVVLGVFFIRAIHTEFKKPFRLLSVRIMMLTCISVTIVAFAISAISYRRSVDNIEQTAADGIAREARLVAYQLLNRYHSIAIKARILANTAPVEMLSEASHPLSSIKERKRLERMMMTIMRSMPHFTQIRLIQFANNGQELVRVNRVGDTLQPVPLLLLQQKGNEPYMQEIAGLAEGSIYYSPVTLNREWGAIESSLTPTLRVITPVYNKEGLFGVLVINADYREFVKDIYDIIDKNSKVYIVSHTGDTVDYQISAISTDQVEIQHAPAETAFLNHLVHPNRSEVAYHSRHSIGYFKALPIESIKGNETIGVVLQANRETIIQRGYNQVRITTLLSLILLAASVLGTTILVHYWLRPLKRMAMELETNKPASAMNLPVERQDEIGLLARTLQQAWGALAQNEAKHRAIMESANDGIITIDEHGLIQDYNPAFETIFGYGPKEVYKKPVSLLLPELNGSDHSSATPIDAHSRHGIFSVTETISQEMIGIKKDGSHISVELSISHITTNTGAPLFSGILRDITSRKKAELEKEQLINALRLSNKELDDFAYVASHDLKAPLRVIDNTSKWLEEDLQDQLNDDCRENIQLMRSRVHRMERLLDDLLHYSRIGRNSASDENEIIIADQMFEAIATLLAVPTGFTLKIDPQFSQVQIPRMPLQQVFFNLINNAIKHHDKVSGTICVSVTLGLGDDFIFSVQDDGPGIPECYQNTAFEMFKTLQPRDRVEGSGMGLAIVKKYVELHGGCIWVESSPETGCCFKFTWPNQYSENKEPKKART